MLKAHFLKVLGLSIVLTSTAAQAMSLDWSGGYRAEWVEVDKPSLTNPTERKAYGLNYLYLTPKIIAADGINIISRFDVFNSEMYPGSQLGTIWGMNTSDVAATSGNQGPATVSASQLYLSVNQEFGSLKVGRMPFDFGLGMLYSGGNGSFDHWYNTRDMVSYKVIVGDWSLTPMLGRMYANDFGQGNNQTFWGAQLQYENIEAKSLMGVYVEQKKGARTTLNYSDAQKAAYCAGATPCDVAGDMSINTTSFVIGRGWDAFGYKFEGAFQSGETGIRRGTEDVKMDGFGLAAELYFPARESKWDYSFKLGMATGDSDSTNFSGFAFNKNYDVAMLMFNHRLGGADLFNTNAVKPRYPSDQTQPDQLSVGNSADDESVGNAYYLAPTVNYTINERFNLRNTLIYAQLMNAVPNSVDAKKDLGLEWDIEVVYKPIERVQWVNQLGLLFPGEAWKNGTGTTGNKGNDFTFGFASKAAISF
ncbi:alginate export family protein [Bdellovibrio sp. GT3]|uniref:alginate export family protein n=1 Tax=Bdellovibrio sp. GT3 TaxID=3136282 RepID=UPI0030F3222F